ncbi:hypothetical protein F2P45_19365 [Massilia sp. CCM 8733]|uniref:Uncharacterized protein n=1 Tax=Massilia mucilaginosa TaxID=2609282 RepID=A0ABX0NWQ0_9BURK|nr:hypothetical protein [Massilia mucilaginosa]NHZ91159.1 hypothetical protein [Massilia mucilaginosa]
MATSGNITSTTRTSHVAPTPPQEPIEVSRPAPPPAMRDAAPPRAAMQARGTRLSSRLHAQMNKLEGRVAGSVEKRITAVQQQQAQWLLDQIEQHHAPTGQHGQNGQHHASDVAGQHGLHRALARFLASLPDPARAQIDEHRSGAGQPVATIERQLHELAALEKEHADAVASGADMDSPAAKHRASEIEKRIAALEEITTLMKTFAELHSRANQIAVAAI